MTGRAALPLLLACAALAQEPPEVPAAAWEGVERRALAAPTRWTAGATHRYRTRQRTQFCAGGGEEPTSIELGLLVERRVEAVEADGGARLVDTIRQLRWEQSTGGVALRVDTADGTKSGHAVADCLAELVGASFEVRVAKDGVVAGCAGGAALVDRALRAVDEARRGPLRAVYLQLFDDAALARRAQEGLVVLPARELQPGEAWRRTLPLGTPVIDVDVELEVEWVHLGRVVKEGVACAKLLVRRRCAGLEEHDAPRLGARVTLEPFEARTAVFVRAEDGVVVAQEPVHLAYRVTLGPQELSCASISRTELVAAAPAAPADEDGLPPGPPR